MNTLYLLGVCTHTDTEGKQRKARVRNISKSSEKNTILNEHPVDDDVYLPLCTLTFKRSSILDYRNTMYIIKHFFIDLCRFILYSM